MSKACQKLLFTSQRQVIQKVSMRFFSKIVRCSKITNFYRYFVNDVKSNKNRTKPIALNIIGSGAPGEPASVSLSISNHDKYLFNCGEDCQRLFVDQGKNISRIKHIFITQTRWNCIGGISILSKVINQSQGWLPTFHGPKRIYKSIKRILCLSILSELDFKPIHCNVEKFFEDDSLRIDFISISVEIASKVIPNYRCRDENEVFAFIGEVKAQTENDCEQSQGADELPVRFMVLDLPTKEHLMSFIEAHQRSISERCFEIIVHFSPQNIVDTPDYRRLVSNLSTKKHLYLNESNECSRLRSVYELQMKLNQIDEKIHPPLKMQLDVSKAACDLNLLQNDDTKNTSTFSKYYLNGGDLIESHGMVREQGSGENMVNANFNQTFDFDHLKTFPKIVFLGTVSAMATSTRANTSILVHTTRDDSLLIDCGEGTCGQIHRLHGKSAPQIIHKIKGVFVSHLHYDHFGGLVEILRMRKCYMPKDRPPLLVLCSKADLKSWLYFYDTNIEAIHDDLNMIDNQNLVNEGLSTTLCRRLGLELLQTCRVPHFNMSHAISLQFGKKKPFKLTFSSDTPPCDDLIALGRDSTLLIHEATYPNDLSHRAKINRHSTLSQAIEQSQKMNAKYTILTHFSRRFDFPIVDSAKHENIGIAFDFMELTERDLPKLAPLNRQYQKLFAKKLNSG